MGWGPRRGTSARQRADGDAARRRLQLLGEQLAASGAAPSTRQGSLAPPREPRSGAPVAGDTRSATSADGATQSGDRAADAELFADRGRHAARPLPWYARLGGALVDRAPAAAHGLTSAHVTVLALVGLGAVAASLWWLLGARPQPSPVAAPALQMTIPSGSAATPATPEPGASTTPHGSAATPTDPGTPAAEVVVDVAGKVRRPGLVTLPTGARVADALRAAGGARPGVDTTALNLARPLNDGEQILVGMPTLAGTSPQTPAGPAPTAGVPVLVDLNTATMEQLDTLPGVGPVTAQAILDWRAEHGAFTTVDELLEVDGIGDATLADLRDLVTV